MCVLGPLFISLQPELCISRAFDNICMILHRLEGALTFFYQVTLINTAERRNRLFCSVIFCLMAVLKMGSEHWISGWK